MTPIPPSPSTSVSSAVQEGANGHEDGGQSRKRRKVKRTKNGCLTCRKRRKLCDQEKPDCKACTRLKLECIWPDMTRSSGRSSIGGSEMGQEMFGQHLAASFNTSNEALFNSNAGRFDENNDSHDSIWKSGSMTDLMDIIRDPVPTGQVSNEVNANLMTGSSAHHLSTTFDFDKTGDPAQQHSTGVLIPLVPDTSVQPVISDDADPWTSLLDGVNFDEATLQLWAAGCLAIPATQSIDPFQSLSELLRQPTYGTIPDSDQTRPSISSDPTAMSLSVPTTERISGPRSGLGEAAPVSPHQAHLLKHYQASLSALVSCTGDSETDPSAFSAFTRLAEASSSSEAGQGLQLSILAWAGRHMANQGEIKFETISDKLGERATKIVLERVKIWENGQYESTETESMTLLAGLLMIISFKICRGDVWGFDTFTSHLKPLSDSLYRVNSPGAPPDSMPFHFFENLVYHDLTSSETYAKGPMVPYSVLLTFSNPSSDHLHTLTGACFPVFCRLNRIATLASQRRQKSRRTERKTGEGQASSSRPLWSDEELYDLVTAAKEIENELVNDKKKMDVLVKNKPRLSSHRFLHEAYRIACLLALHSFVLCEPPSTFAIQLLVRQSLSLLEEMYEKNLPGFCSIHLVLFVTALCCCREDAQGSSQMDGNGVESDCHRIDRLYENMRNDYAFGNLARSPKIYHEVWNRNQSGRVYIDWLDVIEEFGWELFLV